MTTIPAAVAFRPEILTGLAEGLEVRFHPSMAPHQQRLMASLGVRVVFDETAPRECPDGPHESHQRHHAQ